jgi:hypothetical protein
LFFQLQATSLNGLPEVEKRSNYVNSYVNN